MEALYHLPLSLWVVGALLRGECFCFISARLTLSLCRKCESKVCDREAAWLLFVSRWPYVGRGLGLDEHSIYYKYIFSLDLIFRSIH